MLPYFDAGSLEEKTKLLQNLLSSEGETLKAKQSRGEKRARKSVSKLGPFLLHSSINQICYFPFFVFLYMYCISDIL